jgi:hypothetical protein
VLKAARVIHGAGYYAPTSTKTAGAESFVSCSFWGTPKSPQNFAKGIIRKVDACIFQTTDDLVGEKS